MCERCIGLYQSLKDVERPCRRAGCKRTWTDKRGGQLARAVRGKTGDPYPQYCEICAKEMGDLEDRQIPCKTENCEGTWTWSKQAQLAAGVRPEPKVDEKVDEKPDEPAEERHLEAAPAEPAPAEAAPAVPETSQLTAEAAASAPALAAAPGGRKGKGRNKKKRRREIRPPERVCQSCSDFLKDKKTIEIPCQTCRTPIYWPPESQLQTHLGAWAAPLMCGACKRDAIEAARTIEREALRAAATAAQPGAQGVAEPAPEAAAPEAPATEAPATEPSPDAN
jgi:hypothetical protein